MSPLFQTTHVIVCLQNGVPSIRITSLYGFQPSSVVFGSKTATLEQDHKYLWVPDMKCPFVHSKKNVISTRITSLYRSQPSSVVFACKTTTSGPELQVSIGTTLHLSFCACKTA